MTESFARNTPDAGSRFAQRRAVPRFAFNALVELTDPITKSNIAGRVTQISRYGCFVEMETLPKVGSFFRLRIRENGDAFESWTQVVYDRLGMGVGLRFIDTRTEQVKVLTGWLEGLERTD